jgi:preprotein translocase subunit Sec61beta
MTEKRTIMPQSTAGLIRYFEESEEAIKIRPEHVVGIAVALIALEIILKFTMFM